MGVVLVSTPAAHSAWHWTIERGGVRWQTPRPRLITGAAHPLLAQWLVAVLLATSLTTPQDSAPRAAATAAPSAAPRRAAPAWRDRALQRSRRRGRHTSARAPMPRPRYGIAARAHAAPRRR